MRSPLRIPAAALTGAGFALTRLFAVILPRRWLFAMGRAAAPLIYALHPRMRRALLDNAAHILGRDSAHRDRRRLAISVLNSFSRFSIEVMAADRCLPADARLFETMRGRQHYERARAAGRGIIGVTLHMGNYEAGPLLLTRIHQPVAIVYNRDPTGTFERVRSKHRRARAVEEIAIDRSSFFGVQALDVLRRRGILLLAADIGFEGAGVTELHDFLGAPAPFLSWPARIALAGKAPILPCFIVRDGAGEYRLEIAEPIFPEEAGDVHTIMQRLIPVFERAVQRHPEQWLIVHRYWPPVPADASDGDSDGGSQAAQRIVQKSAARK